MGYKFESGDTTVAEGLQRIAGEQIGKALAEIDDDKLDRQAAVHQARKRCKKIRGLIRLVRSGFADYAVENAIFRDAARTLSFMRDTEAALETL